MSEYSYQVDYNLISFDEFVIFLQSVEQDFVPPLLERIDVGSYYRKCNDNAAFAICKNGNELAGMVIFYCNDMQKQTGYVTFVAVREYYRGQGIAQQLLNNVAVFCKDHGMHTLGIHTNNTKAYKLYARLEFDLKDVSDLSELNLKRYYLEKKL